MQVAQITIPVDRAWSVLCVLTAIHLFLAVFLGRGIEEYCYMLPSGLRAGWVFDEVSASGNGFVHGLVSRASPRRPGGHNHRMSWSDPSTWVSYFSALMAFAAMLPWWWTEHGLTWNGPLWLIPVALLVVVTNWWAGGHWIIALSRLEQIRDRERSGRRQPVDDEELRRVLVLHPGAAALSLSDFEWLIDRYRTIIDQRLLVLSDAQDDSSQASRMREMALSERQIFMYHYEIVRRGFPESDLPPEPWSDTYPGEGYASAPHLVDPDLRRRPKGVIGGIVDFLRNGSS